MISKARVSDVREIHRLLGEYSGRYNVLPRTLAELYSQVRDFFVYRRDGSGPIVGLGALHVFWEDLGEIRSLLVLPEYQRQGIGTALVESCLEEARRLGMRQVFVLTDRPEFFRRFGFREFPRDKLHPRIWADCIKCLKFPHCDEIPMVLELLESFPAT